MINRLIFCVLLFCISTYATNGQTIKEATASVLPVSPEAGSLGKFSEIPVSNYTGIPGISIPIHRIKKGDINLSIDLSYHSGGNRVDEIASRVGLGWTLNAGGMITRSARGLPDSYNFQVDVSNYANNLMTSTQAQDYIWDVYTGTKDSEPDIYYVNVGDLNVKFFRGNNGEWITMPRDQNIKIQEGIGGYHWIITSGNGVRYKFGNAELSTATQSSGAYSTDVSSWYLTEVDDVKGNKVSFTYQGYQSFYILKGGETVSIPFSNFNYPCQKTIQPTTIQLDLFGGLKLKTISYSDGQIKFIAKNEARLDLPGDSSLSKIEIYNNSGFVKGYQLFTSYFTNNDMGVNSPNIFRAMDHQRLKLDSVREEGVSGTLKPYKLDYFYSIGLPYRNSHSQDHWGFFNGRNNQGTSVSYLENGQWQGAKKAANPDYAKETVLTKITYPTGGFIEFDYEGNTYRASSLIPGDEEKVSLVNLTGHNTVTGTYVGDGLNFHFERSFALSEAEYGPAGTSVTVLRSSTLEGYSPTCSCYFSYTLRNPDNSLTQIPAQSTDPIYLSQRGTYTLMADIQMEFQENPFVYFNINLSAVKGTAGVFSANGPGLRIKKIKKTFAPGDTLSTYFNYDDPITGISSGQIGNLPDYGRDVTMVTGVDGPDYTCYYHVYSAASNYPLINTKGSHIGYTVVTVTEDLNGTIGKKVYRYNHENDINAATAFPYAPNSPQDWKRGLLLEESSYKNNGLSYELVEQHKLNYSVLPGSLYLGRGIKVGSSVVRNYGSTGPGNVVPGLTVVNYPLQSDALLVVSDTLISKNGTADVKAINTYTYSPSNYQLVAQKNYASDGKESVRKLYYTTDYAANAGSSAILTKMLDRYMVNVPVEEMNTVIEGATEKIVSANAFEYDSRQLVSGTEQIYLKSAYSADVILAAPSLHYNFLGMPSHYYEVLKNELVNDYSKPLYQKKQSSIKTVYIWSYNGQYPIAEIKNADYSTVESLLGGNSAVETFSNSNPTDAQISSFLTPLRSGLSNAQITSYTYKSLVGMTSSTDAKGMTTYYEYDAFQRLKAIKDQNGNILKQTDYHYKN
ncbi:YD repeat-containing protein [Pedobacter sp. AK013]|nr:YD repeat-containing protein [Pedobacter sp. AK013]